MNDDELAVIAKPHPELADLARLLRRLPSTTRPEAIDALVQFAQFYDGGTFEEREAMLEYMAEHAVELAAKAQH
jgi:hypothetical protein